MASWAPAFRVLNRKCGLICACRYFSCASFRCASIISSFSFSDCWISILCLSLSIYCLMLTTIWLKALVTIPISSSAATGISSTLKFPLATSSADVAKPLSGLIMPPVNRMINITFPTITTVSTRMLIVSKRLNASDSLL